MDLRVLGGDVGSDGMFLGGDVGSDGVDVVDLRVLGGDVGSDGVVLGAVVGVSVVLRFGVVNWFLGVRVGVVGDSSVTSNNKRI